MITNKQIEKWNSEFKALDKVDKRIAVAQDVLKQIKLGKYTPNNHGYINMDTYHLQELDIQQNFDKIKECSCCMLGNCLLSLTKFENNLKFKDLYGFQEEGSKVSKMLKRVFTPYQQALLETSFENGDYGHAYSAYGVSLTDIDRGKCRNFYYRHKSPKERVVAAMKSIISNNGTFKP